MCIPPPPQQHMHTDTQRSHLRDTPKILKFPKVCLYSVSPVSYSGQFPCLRLILPESHPPLLLRAWSLSILSLSLFSSAHTVKSFSSENPCKQAFFHNYFLAGYHILEISQITDGSLHGHIPVYTFVITISYFPPIRFITQLLKMVAYTRYVHFLTLNQLLNAQLSFSPNKSTAIVLASSSVALP